MAGNVNAQQESGVLFHFGNVRNVGEYRHTTLNETQ